jgi:hypothetical protein
VVPGTIALFNRIRRFPDTIYLLTHFELSAGHIRPRVSTMGTTMADRVALKVLGAIFATVTVAVMLTTGMVVKGYADGAFTLESSSTVRR